MNKLILFLSFLVFPFFSFSQNSKKVEYSQIYDSYYHVKIVDSNIKQSGYYLIDGDDQLMHGKWTLKVNGKKSLVGIYERGSLISLVVYKGNQKIRYKKHELDIAKLQSKISRLESTLAITD
jgi:hypothetical protein